MDPMRILGTDQSEDWMAVLAQSCQHDFYHLPSYHALAESRGEGAARLFVYREGDCQIALPLLLRPVENSIGAESAGNGRMDATSVYGYAGPVASHAVVPAQVAENFRNTLRETLRTLGVVAVFSRLHPLISQREILSGLGECTSAGSTVSVDLTQPADVQRTQFRSDHKRGINRALRRGMVALEDTGKQHLQRFVEIYTQTMRRVSATDYYFFEPEYFEDLAARLGPAFRLFVILAGNDVACAGIYAVCDGIIQYHLGGTHDDFLELAPMKLLTDTVRLWGNEHGCKVLHLGGGVGAQADSLFHFKAGFSDRRHEFLLWRWVLDSQAYDELCERHARRNAENGLEWTSPDFFPQYRCPAVALDRERVGAAAAAVASAKK